MKNILLLFVLSFFTLFAIGTNPHTDHVRVDVKTSTVIWKGSKITDSHEGTVNIQKGILMIEHGALVGGQLSINMKSITNTDMEGRGKAGIEEHLKSADFFDVEQFPSATITINDVKRNKVEGKENTYTVSADLTIKGITHPILFKANVKIQKLGFIATAKIIIDRTKWNVKYNSGNFFKDLGDKLILDEIEFNISLLSIK